MAIPCRIIWSLGVHSFPLESSFRSEPGISVQFPGRSRVTCKPRGFWHDGDGKAVLDRPSQQDKISRGRNGGSSSGRSGGNAHQRIEHSGSDQPEPTPLNGIRNPKHPADNQTPKPAANARERREARRAKERQLLQAILALQSPVSRGRRENSRGRSGRERNPSDFVEEAVAMVLQALGPEGNDNGVKANVKHVTAAVKVSQCVDSTYSDSLIVSTLTTNQLIANQLIPNQLDYALCTMCRPQRNALVSFHCSSCTSPRTSPARGLTIIPSAFSPPPSPPCSTLALLLYGCLSSCTPSPPSHSSAWRLEPSMRPSSW